MDSGLVDVEYTVGKKSWQALIRPQLLLLLLLVLL
jgi:uncharacterized integral membrane protein